MGLRSLQQLLQRIERAAQAGRVSDLPSWIHHMGSALSNVQAELNANTDGTSAVTEHNQDSAWTPTTRQQAQQAADTLAQALQGSELLQAPLDTLASLLPTTALAPLQAALDHFDFPAA